MNVGISVIADDVMIIIIIRKLIVEYWRLWYEREHRVLSKLLEISMHSVFVESFFILVKLLVVNPK